MDKTVQDYLVSLRNKDMSESEKKKNLQWAQDFVSMALSNIGSQVVATGFNSIVKLDVKFVSTCNNLCKDVWDMSTVVQCLIF